MFSIGDIVTGKNRYDYAITNSESTCRVVRVFSTANQYQEDIQVEVLTASEHNNSYIGQFYSVCSSNMVLYKRKINKKNNLDWR